VAPSTPIPDLKLQILAWQQHFAALFGLEALQRVRGFSLPEMALPNHPDSLHALVKALRQCGYRWLLVQEHSVENLDGSGLSQAQKYSPNRLVARSGSGEIATITALIKTQGSDTKLVGQMQPYHEALGLGRQTLAGFEIPSLVIQIADGENGGVMMNEFPPAYKQAHRRLAASATDSGGTVAVHGTEYLELLEAAGLQEDQFTPIQAVQQHKLWQQLEGPTRPESLQQAMAQLQARDPQFSMNGASWTNDISWVEGYADVLEPMQRLSARFHACFAARVDADPRISRSRIYQEALLPLLLLETSCFRYWGQGTWTGYAKEIERRGSAAITRALQELSSDPGRR